ncbi:NRDE family protein [Leptospira paudalimensis]|uniref:NRDE family protein n=1 Tax=Leptospira paudalimensis TaxID=2950024 RepID=A0ABT3M8R7_9LEPT|nr:NRDE family protein [Leptospira paudalimensis]MCW7504771.1 NRDE family protein [Leptospira paudalimensis]
MCLVGIAYGIHPDFPLVVASNRDEFFERPTEGLHVWETEPSIIAGKDLKAGGTWLGGNKDGKVAFLTNVRNFRKPHHPNPKSRGELVIRFLESSDSVSSALYANEVKANQNLYEGFNLFLFDGKEAFALGGDPFATQKVEFGFHAVSNASWDTHWPKTEKLLSQMKPLVTNWQEKNISKSEIEWELFRSLNDAELVSDGKYLPDTGIGLEREKSLSSVRIKTPQYGTRASTLVFYGKESVEIVERTFSDPLSDGFTERRNILIW